MGEARLNLVVIRALDIDRAHAFYTGLGLTFEKHAHGQGPVHYATQAGDIVFEIYPQATPEDCTRGMRVGFSVSDLAGLLERIPELGGKVISGAKESPWGLRAVVEDPFGHKVELVEGRSANC